MLEKDSHILKEAMVLPPLDRLQLIDRLLESLDMPDRDVERLWAKEAARRWKGFKAGSIESIPAAEVLGKYTR